MAITRTVNNTSYSIPGKSETGWSSLTNYLAALSDYCLKTDGGARTLLAELNLGATYGVKQAYLKSQASNPSSAGIIRLGNAESIGWRNAANGADKLLKVNSSDILEYDGNPITTLALGAGNTVLRMNSGGSAYEYAQLVNANIDSAAAIAYSKLALSGSIVNADVSGSAAIAYSKLALTSSIVTGDISGTISPVQGGTGVANNAAATLTRSGNHALTLTTSGTTGVTLPTTGTLATLAGGESLSNKTLPNSTSMQILDVNLQIQDDGDVTKIIKFQAGDITTGTTRTLTAPDASGILTLIAANQLLSNKQLQASSVKIADDSDVTKLVKFDVSGVTTGTERTITVPNADGTLAYIAATQTLTNKTFDAEGTGNALSNITNTHIKATAGIAVSKLAALTASRAVALDGSGFLVAATTTATELGYVNGVTSAIQTQLDAKATASSATTFTNKTFDADGTGNSITNIENADIKAAAAIARSKLAAGTADHVVINAATTGAFSSEAQLAIVRGGTGQATVTAGFDALSPTTTKGDLISRNGSNNIRVAVGANGTVLTADSGQTSGLGWTSPLTNPMDAAGQLIYGGASGAANKLAAGTSQNWLISGGAGTPTWGNTVTTGKMVDGSADEIQLTVQGHTTQTSDIFLVEKSDGTDLLNVTNANGTKLKGTTTNDAVAAGFVGEYLSVTKTYASQVTLTTSTAANLTGDGLALTAGDWDIQAFVNFETSGAVAFTQRLAEVNTAGAPTLDVILGTPDSSGKLTLINGSTQTITDDECYMTFPNYRLSTTSTTLHLVVRAIWTGGSSVKASGFLAARRAR